VTQPKVFHAAFRVTSERRRGDVAAGRFASPIGVSLKSRKKLIATVVRKGCTAAAFSFSEAAPTLLALP